MFSNVWLPQAAMETGQPPVATTMESQLVTHVASDVSMAQEAEQGMHSVNVLATVLVASTSVEQGLTVIPTTTVTSVHTAKERTVLQPARTFVTMDVMTPVPRLTANVLETNDLVPTTATTTTATTVRQTALTRTVTTLRLIVLAVVTLRVTVVVVQTAPTMNPGKSTAPAPAFIPVQQSV